MDEIIYLDNAATTKPFPEVVAEVMPYITTVYGNPNSKHNAGFEAKKAIELARQRVARFINANPEQIVFTSGGTEANNMVFEMLVPYLRKKNLVVVTSKIEHESILKKVEELHDRYGVGVRYVEVNSRGFIKPSDEVLDLIDKGRVGLISVMSANNETGIEVNIKPLFEYARQHSDRTFLHTDCVQFAGVEPIDVQEIDCDFLSLSAHKIHGLKGCGALYVAHQRDELTSYKPLIYGGSDQEWGLRGGTQNVPAIVGFGKACDMLMEPNTCVNEAYIALHNLSATFLTRLKTETQKRGVKYVVNSDTVKVANIRFDGVDAETLVLMLASKGVCVSAGSACRSNESEPSYVLRAFGLTSEQARNSIRVSFSTDNTRDELCEAAKIIAECVEVLKCGQTDQVADQDT